MADAGPKKKRGGRRRRKTNDTHPGLSPTAGDIIAAAKGGPNAADLLVSNETFARIKSRVATFEPGTGYAIDGKPVESPPLSPPSTPDESVGEDILKDMTDPAHGGISMKAILAKAADRARAAAAPSTSADPTPAATSVSSVPAMPAPKDADLDAIAAAAPEASPNVAERPAFGQRAIEQLRLADRLRDAVKSAIAGDSTALYEIKGEHAVVGEMLSLDAQKYAWTDAIKLSGDVGAARAFLAKALQPEEAAELKATIEHTYGSSDPMLEAFSSVAALPTQPPAPPKGTAIPTPHVPARLARDLAKAPAEPAAIESGAVDAELASAIENALAGDSAALWRMIDEKKKTHAEVKDAVARAGIDAYSAGDEIRDAQLRELSLDLENDSHFIAEGADADRDEAARIAAAGTPAGLGALPRYDGSATPPALLSSEEAIQAEINRALDAAAAGRTDDLKALATNPDFPFGKVRSTVFERWIDAPEGSASYETWSSVLSQVRGMDNARHDSLVRPGIAAPGAAPLPDLGEVERLRAQKLTAALSATAESPQGNSALWELINRGEASLAEAKQWIDAILADEHDEASRGRWEALRQTVVNAEEFEKTVAAEALRRGRADLEKEASLLSRGLERVKGFLETYRNLPLKYRLFIGGVLGAVGGITMGPLLLGAGSAGWIGTLGFMGALRGVGGAGGGIAAGAGAEKFFQTKAAAFAERRPKTTAVLKMLASFAGGLLAGGAVQGLVYGLAGQLGFVTSGPSGKVGPIIDRPRPGIAYPPDVSRPRVTTVPDSLPGPRTTPLPPDAPRLRPYGGIPAPSDTPGPDTTVPVKPIVPPEAIPITRAGTSLVIGPGESAWGSIRSLLSSPEGGNFFGRAGMSFGLQEQFLKAIERALVADPTLLQGTGIQRMVPMGNGMYNWLTPDGGTVNLSKLLGNPRLLDAALSADNLQSGPFRGLIGRLNVLGVTDFKNALLSQFRTV